ncbi:MAG: hypothetical protein LKG18_04280 [Saccharofermentans sp.]|jgi:hypothetical protein|nr:hypothetical protein [Saccharofermentans sp.]
MNRLSNIVEFVLEMLKNRNNLTELEKDIISTFNKYSENHSTEVDQK